MSKSSLLAFVDCNVLIEGLLVPFHPAQAVILLAANKRIDLVTCELVVRDVEDTVIEKAREKNDYELVESWTKLLEVTRLRIMPDPPHHLVVDTRDKYLGIMRHAADIPVLASAIEICPHVILSDNVDHFNPQVSERCGIPIWSCSEFIENLITGTIREKLKLS